MKIIKLIVEMDDLEAAEELCTSLRDEAQAVHEVGVDSPFGDCIEHILKVQVQTHLSTE